MGLAPYGNYIKKIKDKLIDIKSDGSRLNMKYFGHLINYCCQQKFIDLFERDRRNESEISKFYMDIAASIQKVSEEIIIKIAKNLRNKTELPNLYGWRQALNCVTMVE